MDSSLHMRTVTDARVLLSGTWLAEGAECSFAVAYAIKIAGYRHIDAAW